MTMVATTTTTIQLKDFIAMFVATLFSLIFVGDLVQGKVLDFDAQLKIINKPAIKSFQTKYGDIIDCIDIYKQHAFDHPLLKNHKIQKKPESFPKQIGHHRASKVHKSLNYMPKNIVCPPNSVPIKRVTREDLMMEESIKSSGLNAPTNTPSRGINDVVAVRDRQSAVLTYKQKVYGAKATINIWNPVVEGEQFSLGGMSLDSGPTENTNSIQAGWLVHNVMSPNSSRLFIFWTADGYKKTGCYNTLCPGFVQVSTEVTLGLVLPPSTFMGLQTDMLLILYQNQATGDWWLVFEQEYVGYWPIGLLPLLVDGATLVSWGGEVYSPINMPSPVMGSGHFPQEGYSKSAYMIQIKVLSTFNASQFEDPADNSLQLFVNAPSCYNAEYGTTKISGWGRFVYFGGPGKCTF